MLVILRAGFARRISFFGIFDEERFIAANARNGAEASLRSE
jgi:hypothetical protein